MDLYNSNIKKVLILKRAFILNYFIFYFIFYLLFFIYIILFYIKDSLYFRKQNFLIFPETEILKDFLYFRRELPGSKNEKKTKKQKTLLKCFLYFKVRELSSLKLKNFISQKELPKYENQTRSYSLELLTYCYIHYSLAIFFFSYRGFNSAPHHKYLTEF